MIYKLKYKYFLALFFSLSTIIISCSTSQTDVSDLKIKVEAKTINAWINLMPGSKSKFYLTGEFLIKNENEFSLNKFEIEQMKVFQNEKEIYSYKPFISDITISKDSIFSSGEVRKFVFGTENGLIIKKELEDKNISAEFIFTGDGKTCIYKIDRIKIEKVY